MKVKELIEELGKYDPDMLLVMSKDAEGNRYSPLSGLFDGHYVPSNTWSGDILDEEDEISEDAVPALVLCPVN